MSSVLTGIPEAVLSAEQEGTATPETLVLHSLREAFFYARGCHQSHGLSEGETLSVCYDALSKATKYFTPERGRFFAFAKQHIRGALGKAVRAHDVVKKSRDQFEPLPVEEDEDYKNVDQPYTPSRGGGDIAISLPEFERIYLDEEWAKMQPLLRAVLNDKERMVLELNFQGGLNLQVIAGLLSCSRSHVHNVKQVALKKLRQRLLDQNQFFNRE